MARNKNYSNYIEKQMMTEKDYKEIIEDSFDMFGKKWFPHLAYNNIAASIDGNILINKKKILKPKMTDIGLVVYACFEGEFRLKLVKEIVFEIFNNLDDIEGMVSNIDGDETNNNISNLQIA